MRKKIKKESRFNHPDLSLDSPESLPGGGSHPERLNLNHSLPELNEYDLTEYDSFKYDSLNDCFYINF